MHFSLLPLNRKNERGRYTADGNNRKYCGWSNEGLARYNELFALEVRQRKKPWAGTVDEEVREALKNRLFPHASLEEIRRTKTRRKRRRTNNDAIITRPRIALDEDDISDHDPDMHQV
jgi:hypothetical protein